VTQKPFPPRSNAEVAASYADGGVMDFATLMTPSPRMTGHFPL